MGKAASKKGDGAFQTLHTSEYGLKIMERCASTTQVVSVRCQFCIYFGVQIDDTKAPRVRSTKTTIMTWTRPFRVDKYKAHHKSQHASNWATYQTCSFDEKAQFLPPSPPMQTQCLRMSTLARLPHLSNSAYSYPSSMSLLAICFSIPMTKEEQPRRTR